MTDRLTPLRAQIADLAKPQMPEWMRRNRLRDMLAEAETIEARIGALRAEEAELEQVPPAHPRYRSACAKLEDVGIAIEMAEARLVQLLDDATRFKLPGRPAPETVSAREST